jgi:hypothetical protein
MKKKMITRRDFLKDSTSLAITGTLLLNMPQKIFGEGDSQSKVVLIRQENLMGSNGKPKKVLVENMLDEAVSALYGVSEAQKAWEQIVKPEDVVGIKSNVWRYLATPPELEQAIENRVKSVGVAADNIAIDDRGIRYNSVFKKATALINVRPLRTHHWSGVGSLLKNYIMFVKRPSDYHGDTCADLAAIWKLPEVQGKTRLNILVMFTPLFHSVGPHAYNPQYTWAYNGLLVGNDPVAVDATGVRILMAKRKQFFQEDRPINPPTKHVFLADTRHQLGTADPSKIELIKLGWQQDSLI